jgi:hypothetical protein
LVDDPLKPAALLVVEANETSCLVLDDDFALVAVGVSVLSKIAAINDRRITIFDHCLSVNIAHPPRPVCKQEIASDGIQLF